MKHSKLLFLLILALLLGGSYSLAGARGNAPDDRDALAGDPQLRSGGDSGFLTGPNAGEPLNIALEYLEKNKRALGLTSDDVADVVVTDQYTSKHNGVTHIYLRQRYQGIEVFSADLNVNIAADGSVINISHRFISDLGKAVNTSRASLSATQAVESAAQDLRLQISESLRVVEQTRGPANETLLSDGGISLNDIPAKLMYQPTEGRDEVYLVWDLVIYQKDAQHWWDVRVDALTEEVLDKKDWVISEKWGHSEQNEHNQPDASSANGTAALATCTATGGSDEYCVYGMPVETPNHGERSMQTDPADSTASPYGWHDTDGAAGAESNHTVGNNVDAYQDTNNSNGPTGGDAARADGGADRVFNFDVDLTQPPTMYQDAATSNLFYWNNTIHDIFYQYGFDEASGNFQENNYNNGGVGSDAVSAEAQDGGGLNNANMATPPDGGNPRMQMYLWNLTSPQRDGDFDNGIIMHEYGHGISIRLTGGPSNSSCLFNSEQGGEGWSDWFGLMMTMKAGDMGADKRGIGTYVFGQPTDGDGIRPAPYSTDMSINNVTYGDIGSQAVPHGVGFVWATMLWEMNWALVDQHGFDPDIYNGSGGNNIAMQLVVDGLKLQPCSPGFVDARDAILQADQINNNGANQCLIWDAFAKRGLGYSAQQGSSGSTFDGSEAFDTPPACETLAVMPETQNICVGDTASYSVSVGQGFTSPVTMSASGQPAGSSATFDPNPVSTVPTTSTLTISNTASAAAGDYTITITGTSGITTSHVTAGLKLINSAPGVPTLSQPANGASDVSLSPRLEWDAVTDASSYVLEIASDSEFATIIYSATVDGAQTSHMAEAGLATETTYYWRVRADNECAQGSHSPPFGFTTGLMICNAPALRIPDGDPAGVSDELVIAGDGVIADLDVKVKATHSYVGDLVFRLENLDSGTTVTLIDRPGRDEGGYGCNGDDINAILDDEANTPVEDACDNNKPTISGSFMPNDSLSAFDFQALSGRWRMSVSDHVGADTGTLDEWCLQPVKVDPATIGTLAGRVSDGNSGTGLEQATVTADGDRDYVATTDADGYYTMTVTANSYTVTAEMENYVSGTIAGVNVLSDSTTVQDFDLLAGQIQANPDQLALSVDFGMTSTVPLSLTNSGTQVVQVELLKRESGFTPALTDLQLASQDILLVNQDQDSNATQAIKMALDNLGYTYRKVSGSHFKRMQIEKLLTYQAVIYLGKPYEASQHDHLIAYLDAGGRLLISDNDVGYYIGGSALYETYLQASYVSDSGSDGLLTGVDIMDGLDPDIQADPYPDDFTINGSDAVGLFEAPSGNWAALRIARDEYKAIYFAWDYQHIGDVTAGDPEETTILEAALGWLVGGRVSWLSVDPITTTLSANSTQVVDVTVDASLLEASQPGEYAANLIVRNDTPYGDLLVPVTMSVQIPATWGQLVGTISSDRPGGPLEGAVVEIRSGDSTVYSDTLEADGIYSRWLEAGDYTLAVSAEEYQTATRAVSVSAGQVITENVSLVRDAPEIGLDAPPLEQSLELGLSASQFFTLSNIGQQPLTFQIGEGGGTISASITSDASIVGGEPAEEGAWPWMVSLHRYGGHYCGGALISDEWILTAAHCSGGSPSQYTIVIGRHDLTSDQGEEIEIDQILIHPEYGSNTLDNDIALMHLVHAPTVPTASIPLVQAANDAPDVLSTVIGWGALSEGGGSPDVLHQVSVPIVSQATCEASYPGEITENMICAGLAEGGMDSCQGDSGGPLMVPNASGSGWEQAGIVSWGEGCARPNKYGVYTRVSQYIEWMEEQGVELPRGDVPWLSTDPITGTVAVASTQRVEVTFDASTLSQPGTWYAELDVHSNDPFKEHVTLPVSLTVNAPNTFGQLQGTVTSSGYCDNESIPLAGVEVVISDTIILTTDHNGSYHVWLNEGTHQMALSAEGHLDGSATANVVAQQTSTLDIALRSLEPCLSVAPNAFDVTVSLGARITPTLTLSNTGALGSAFELRERNERDPGFITTTVRGMLPSIEIEPEIEGAISSEELRQPLSGGSRAQEVVATAQVRSLGTINVLLLTPDHDISDLHETLNLFPDLAVTTFGGQLSTLTADDLLPYDVVITTNNYRWGRKAVRVGNALADYIDAGGKAIVNNFAYDWAGWGLDGRFISEEYGPFTTASENHWGTSHLGTVHEPDHPIMAGVTSITNHFLWQNPSLVPGATRIAEWDDGALFVAANENVVGLNMLASSGFGYPGWSGDVPTLYHNAIMWLSLASTDVPWLSTNPVTGTVPADSAQLVDVIFDSTILTQTGTYSATLKVISDDSTSHTIDIPVRMTVVEGNPPVISDVRTSNLRDVSFTVSWLTDAASSGYIRYGTDPNNLSQSAQDVRGPATSDETHYVLLDNLAPNTTYYFDVLSGSAIDDNAGAHYTITTGATLGVPGTDTVYGNVFRADGTTPANGTLVYITLNNNDENGSTGQSAPLSALVQDGVWNVNLGNVRIADLSTYFSYSASGDQLRLEAYGAANSTACQSVDTAQDQPASAMVLDNGTCGTRMTLTLQEGWNNLALPLHPSTEYRADNVCGEIGQDSMVEINRWYRSGWQGHICAQPFNNFELEMKSSYFVKSDAVSSWTIEGTPMTTSTLDLEVGWNSINVPHSDGYTAESLCQEIISQGVTVVEINRWHSGGWNGHICGLPFNDFDIERGIGYFIKSNSSGRAPLSRLNPSQRQAAPALRHFGKLSASQAQEPVRLDELPAAPPMPVNNLRISNLRDTTLTLSWTTEEATIGYVRFGEANREGLPLQVALDMRGVSTNSKTHYVVLSQLSPETRYHIEIISGLDTAQNVVQTVTTAPTLESVPQSDMIYGKVYQPDGVTPASGALVYLQLEDADGLGAQTISALVDSEGYWHTNLGNARTNDLSTSFNYTQGDQLLIDVEGTDGGFYTTTLEIADNAQTPDITLTTTAPTAPTAVEIATYDAAPASRPWQASVLLVTFLLAVAGWWTRKK
ncbi:MAG: M36 family metallopeptidase [Ardenticatenaceae bacterium]